MTKFLRFLIIAALIVVPLQALAESAVVKSAVNIRTAPSSSKSRVIGALKAGDQITVKCSSRGWCELSGGRGFVAKKFLRLGAGNGGSAKEPAKEAVAVAPEPAPPPAPATGGIFDGSWTSKNDEGVSGALDIAQVDTGAEATLVAGDITTQMTGRIEGMRYIFTWKNVRDGKVLVEGDGFLNFVGDNALSGALMRDGSLMSSIQAGR